MVAKSVIATARRYLHVLHEAGFPVRYAILFGSQARGESTPWSDIDLLIVSPRFDGGHKREDISLLWRLAARTDSRIEPVPVGEREYEVDDSRAIVEIARREGTVVRM